VFLAYWPTEAAAKGRKGRKGIPRPSIIYGVTKRVTPVTKAKINVEKFGGVLRQRGFAMGLKTCIYTKAVGGLAFRSGASCGPEKFKKMALKNILRGGNGGGLGGWWRASKWGA